MWTSLVEQSAGEAVQGKSQVNDRYTTGVDRYMTGVDRYMTAVVLLWIVWVWLGREDRHAPPTKKKKQEEEEEEEEDLNDANYDEVSDEST